MASRPVRGAEAGRVSVDPDLCIGSGECIRLEPDAFRLDEDAGVTHPLSTADELSSAELAQVIQACPMGAISLRMPADEP